MTSFYSPIAEIDDVGLLAIPFNIGVVDVISPNDREWIDRGQMINRYTGEFVFLTQPPGFGEGEFGNGIFGWS
jgi:hypothetical protein